ncbi:SIMPL domain-containing protein [soil metagenome]
MVPDRASVTLGVETEGKIVADVKRENDSKVRAMLKSIQAIGIQEKDIQTSQLSIEPRYNYKQDGTREFLGYVMRNTIYVWIKDLTKVDAVIGASVNQGSNVLQNIEFSFSETKRVADSLRVAAAKDAKVKAEALAGAVSARIARVISMNESDYQQPPAPMWAKARGMSVREDEDEGGPTVSSGQLIIRSTVNAVFELE